MMSLLDKLYDNYNILSECKDNIEQHAALYLEIIGGVKGDKNTKRLASQFICKFYKDFPKLSDEALNALFDLCEDVDVEIRKQVIRDLPTICKDNVENVSKITDILVQLLITYDQTELALVHSSLVTLGKLSPKLFLTGVFSIITNGEEVTRERAIKFLESKIKTLPIDFWTKENEEFFLEESRKVLADCTKDEFEIFMNLLKNLKISRMISGQHILLDIITKKAELDKDFDPNDLESQDRFLLCMKQAIPCFSQFVSSNSYADYLCQKVLPKHRLHSSTGESDENFKILPFLQAMAEIASHVQPTNTKNLPIALPCCIRSVFDKLLEYLPEPKLPSLESGASVVEDDFQFTYIESLLFTLHAFGRKNKETFVDDIGGVESMRAFKQRLQYLARGCQNYIKSLQDALKQVPPTEQLKSEENKLKLIALKCIQNINTLIRDLFYPKPDFKSSITLSWTEAIVAFTVDVKPTVTPTKQPQSQTQHSSVANNNQMTTNRPQVGRQQPQRRPAYPNRLQNPNKKFRRQ